MREDRELLIGDAREDSITWVHLSDFHFHAGPDYGRDEVLHALLEDLRMWVGKAEPARGAERLPLDLVLITGDIAESGQPAEYDAAASFFTDVSRTIGVPFERFFLVPGNHDIDRALDAPAFMRDAVVGRKTFEPFTRCTLADFGDTEIETFVKGWSRALRRKRVGHPTPVGIYPLGATPEGVQDLSGNVLEWCRDCPGNHAAKAATDPIGPPGALTRVFRGGAFNLDPVIARAGCRSYDHPDLALSIFGFRCVALAAGGQVR